MPDTAPAPHHQPEDIPRTLRERAEKPPPFEPYLPSALEAPRPFLDVPDERGSLPPTDEAAPSAGSTAPPPFRSTRLLTTVAAGGLIVLMLLAWRWTRSTDSESAAADEQNAHQASDGNRTGPSGPCQVTGVPRKLADDVHMSVALQTATTPNGRIALGFASTATDAVGLTLDPETLDAAQAFTEGGKGKLFGVQPSPAADSPFMAHRATGSASGGGVVRLPGGVARLTTTPRGLAVELGNQRHLAWPELGTAKSTSPRAETLGSAGAIVALRRGGVDGDILVGLLDANGQARGSLSKVASSAQEFGTPSVGVGTDEVLVSFATRASAQAPWRIDLARAPLGQLPASSRPLVPEGLPEDAVTISPAAAALPGGGWLLQWTQGEVGKHRVWVQTLDRALAPVGPPVPVGPADGDSGQGTPWADARGRAASFYILRAGQRWELWGSALQCPL